MQILLQYITAAAKIINNRREWMLAGLFTRKKAHYIYRRSSAWVQNKSARGARSNVGDK